MSRPASGVRQSRDTDLASHQHVVCVMITRRSLSLLIFRAAAVPAA